MPTVVANVKKQILVNQLKKTVSTIENGVKLTLAEEEVDKLSDTSLWNSNFYCNMASSCSEEFLQKFFKHFNASFPQDSNSRTIKYLKILNERPAMTRKAVVTFSNGAQVLSEGKFFPGDIDAHSPFGPAKCLISLLVDINGEKEPNTIGRDIFPIGIKDNGTIEYFGSTGLGVMDWTNGMYLGCEDPNWPEDYGYYCAARIVEEGWKMNY